LGATFYKFFGIISTNEFCSTQAFENTSTNVAASQMRNALNQLADTVKDAKEKQVWLPWKYAYKMTANLAIAEV